MKEKENISLRIGENLRSTRKKAGLTLKQVAEMAGLSTPLISKIENGLTIPSIQTLLAISSVLKVDVGSFFQEMGDNGYTISRKGSRKIGYGKKKTKSNKPAHRLELLNENMENAFMQTTLVEHLARNDDDLKLVTHEGQEFVYVLEGKIELTLGDKKFIIRKGDSAYWIATIPHKAINLSKKPTKCLNVNLMPGRYVNPFDLR